MNKQLIYAPLGLILAAVLGFLWLSGAQKEAPEVQFTTIKGQKLDLESLRGQPVMVVFWATDCPGCIDEMPHLVDLHQRYSGQGLRIIGVAMPHDLPNRVVAFQTKRQLPYTLALDLDSSVVNAFGNVRLTPTSFLISPEGKIVYQKIGELNLKLVEQSISDMLKTAHLNGLPSNS